MLLSHPVYYADLLADSLECSRDEALRAVQAAIKTGGELNEAAAADAAAWR